MTPDDAARSLYLARFNARYALRNVVRQGRMFRRVNAWMDGLGYIGGTAGYVAVLNAHPGLAAVVAAVLPISQVIAAQLKFAERAVDARHAERAYRAVVSGVGQTDDLQAIRTAFAAAVDADETEDVEWVRRIAFNDAIDELRGAASDLYALSRFERLLRWLF